MRLHILLRSDAAFGRGDGVAGLVDSEVEHDAQTGLPYIKGRTLKGLLVESCADLLYALQSNTTYDDLETAAKKLFGIPGSTLTDIGCLHIGSGLLPADLRGHLTARIQQGQYTPQQLLEAFTTIRHQTAVDPTSGKPQDGSLRATRVVLRETFFYADIHSDKTLDDVDLQLLAACAAGVKRGGQNRTRGLGWLQVELQDAGEALLAGFAARIGGAT